MPRTVNAVMRRASFASGIWLSALQGISVGLCRCVYLVGIYAEAQLVQVFSCHDHRAGPSTVAGLDYPSILCRLW